MLSQALEPYAEETMYRVKGRKQDQALQVLSQRTLRVIIYYAAKNELADAIDY
jgi:hypothetical protein